MKLKTSRKPKRTCSECQRDILKGEKYASKEKTILNDPNGQSFNGGRTWSRFTLKKTIIYCSECV